MLELGGLVLAGVVWLASFAAPAEAGQTQVAVAGNFAEPAREIAALLREKTGHEAVLSFGAAGPFLTQITQGAPFQVFLSADSARPHATVDAGFAVPGTQFTYAIGELVLWSRVIDVTKGDEVLKVGNLAKLAIPNLETAVYGAAAVDALKALGVFDSLGDRFVRGNTILQAFQFIETRNADLGFIALAQLYGRNAGTRWVVPHHLYPVIRQDAVLLKKSADDEASKAFLAFLVGPEATRSSRALAMDWSDWLWRL
jgi:molybdate transport system substrate-binding protein